MKNLRIAADPRFPAPDAPHISVSPDRFVDDVLPFVEREGDRIVAWGDDRLVSALAEGVIRMGSSAGIAPMPVGPYRTLWRMSGLHTKPEKALRQVQRERFRMVPTTTLRIADSGMSRAVHGFSFGAGLVFNIFEGHALREVPAAELVAKRGPELLKELAQRGPALLNAVDGRLQVDWTNAAESFAYVLASTLDESLLEIPFSGGASPALRFGESASGLLREVSRFGRIWDRLGEGSRTFDRIHIEADTGYVVDGRLFPREEARIVQITSGPRVKLARA